MSRTHEGVYFGELRSVAHRHPDSHSWGDFVSVLERWHQASPETFHERALPYAAEHAARWPDHMRALPERWLQVLRSERRFEPWWASIGRAIKLHDLPNRDFVRGVIKSVAHSPLMRTMTVLELPGGYMRNFAVWSLARSPHLSNLRELDLSYNGLSSWGIDALLRAPSMRRLRRLVLDGNGLGGREAEAMSQELDWCELSCLSLSHNRLDDHALVALSRGAGQRGALRALSLERNVCSDEGARALGKSALLGQLQRLNLAHNQIGSHGVRELATLVHHLEHLDLSGNPLGFEGVTHIQRLGNPPGMRTLRLAGVGMEVESHRRLLGGVWPRLEVLDLSGNRLGEAGARALARTALPRLQFCDLSGTSLDERAATALKLRVGAQGIEGLSLSFNPLGASGARDCMEVAARSGARILRLDHGQIDASLDVRDVPFEVLEHLDLRSNALGDEGVRKLVECTWLSCVKHLDLRRCQISDEGAIMLANCTHLRHLEVLDLGENQIGKRGALALMQGGLERLHSLHLNQCPLGDGAIKALANATPHGALKLLDLSWARELTSQGVAILRSARRFSACQIIARHAPQHNTPSASAWNNPHFDPVI